jgi:SHS2 domain-containing protein
VAHLFFVKNYELIEHTADIGIKLKGKDLRGLFKNVALAMFDIIAEKKTGENKKQKIKIKQRADNLEELFINWLNELIFSDFQVNKINERELQATGIGEDIKSYKVNTEVKAATYHQLKIAKTASGWQAEVIFDV